jgi:hypothetical protein
MTLKDSLTKLGFKPTIKIFTDIMVWYDQNLAPKYTRYLSDDAFTIGRQFDAAQNAGLDGFRITYQGLNSKNSPTQTSASLQIAQKCEERGMQCLLLLDPWIAKGSTAPEASVISQLQDSRVQEIINSKGYLKDSAGKPIIMDFDVQSVGGADMSKVAAAFPQYTFGSKHSMYSWPEPPANQTIANLKRDNANPNMLMPGLMLSFSDSGFVKSDGTIDYNAQVWDNSKPCRVFPPLAGNWFFDQLEVTPKTVDYISLATWNDYREGTTWEQFFTAQAGIRIGR